MRFALPLGSVLAASAVLTASCAPPHTESNADELATAVTAAVTRAGLERLASAIVQYERPSGSPGENAAIDSIVGFLEAGGVPVVVHTFQAFTSDPVSASVEVPAAGLSFEAITMAFSGQADGLVAPLVDVGTLADLPRLEVGTGERLALEGDPIRFGGLPERFRRVQGAIVLVEGQPRNVPTAVLELLGAAGVIFSNPVERLNDLIVTSTWGTPSMRNYHRLPEIPTVQVAKSAGDALRERLALGPVQVRISAEVATGLEPLRLAVARIPGPDPEAPYVLFGGHIDGWYHGGTDEGASNAVMAQVAKAFYDNRGLLRRGLVVAWWPGHSNARYAGSTWFADRFFEELRDRAVAYVNIDGVGQMDAKRFSASVTAAMEELARDVVRVGVGEEIRVGNPGRNSDQAFNGVGLPLLQINHSRLAEDGGYWWWHTPEDTYDKIDFDVLETDADLYIDAISRLLADPVLPIDLAAEVAFFGGVIVRRSEDAGGLFDLSEAIAGQTELLALVEEVQRALPGHAGPDVDRAMLRILRPIYRVTYDPVDPFHPDPGFAVGLLPGLAPVQILSEEDPSSARYLFAETTLVRERNRLLEAISIATAEAERLLEALR